MSLVDMAATVATIASGLVSLIMLAGVIVDAITRGWVRGRVQRWLAVTSIRRENQLTQTYLLDLGENFNELVEVVCEEHDIPEEERPGMVDTVGYELLTENGDNLSRGDFTRGGSRGED